MSLVSAIDREESTENVGQAGSHRHQWSPWYPVDPMCDARVHRYYRDCQVLSCGVRERATDVVAVGAVTQSGSE